MHEHTYACAHVNTVASLLQRGVAVSYVHAWPVQLA